MLDAEGSDVQWDSYCVYSLLLSVCIQPILNTQRCTKDLIEVERSNCVPRSGIIDHHVISFM